VSKLAGIFLIAHGLVHLAVWLPEPKEDAPFDPGRSWLLGESRWLTRALATMACALLVLAGGLVVAGAGLGSGLAVAGAGVSLVLVLLSFHPWLLGAVAIDVAIVVVALG
jgi:hypothetical protein